MLRQNHQQGVAILFSVLLVSIVLTISLSLMNITYKQILLSLLARDSQLAFYTASSAAECTQYYNKHKLRSKLGNPFGYFGTTVSSPATSVWTLPDTAVSVNCGNSTSAPEYSESGDYQITAFTVVYNDSDRSTCAEVTIKKDTKADLYTITADGYNNYDDSYPDEHCYPVSDRTIQRTVTIGNL